jgi:hypothetical protein
MRSQTTMLIFFATLTTGIGSGCTSESLSISTPSMAVQAQAGTQEASALIGESMLHWYLTAFDGTTMTLATMADSHTASWNNANMKFYSSEPRVPWATNPATFPGFTTFFNWYGFYAALNSARAAAAAIQGVSAPQDKKMLQAAEALMEGMALASIAINYEQGIIPGRGSKPGDVPTTDDLKPREQVLQAALAQLDAAAGQAQSASFQTPPEWMNGLSYSADQLAAIAHTVAARSLVYFPRNSQENAEVNWDLVAHHAALGLGAGARFDWQVVVVSDCTNPVPTDWCNSMIQGGGDPSITRVDTRVAHLLDPGTQQTPWPSPAGNPPPASPDRRLGDGSYTDPIGLGLGEIPATANAGTDFAWFSRNIFPPNRGSYHQSNIGYIRYLTSALHWFGQGAFPVATATENDLLLAEALIRTGRDLPGAAALINRTRVGRGGLPPATGNETATALLEKLQYEQEIELMGLGAQPYYNRRRIDGLQFGTPTIMPAPLSQLAAGPPLP